MEILEILVQKKKKYKIQNKTRTSLTMQTHF